PLGQAAFGPGAFRSDKLKDSLGLTEQDIDRLVIAGNFKEDWLFLVLRTRASVKMDDLTAKLALVKGADSPIQGQDYFTTEGNWLENTTSLLKADQAARQNAMPVPPGSRPLAVRLL